MSTAALVTPSATLQPTQRLGTAPSSVSLLPVSSFISTCIPLRSLVARQPTKMAQAAICQASASVSVSTAPPPLDLMKLQNGSDIRGIAVEGVSGEAVNFTEAAAEAIATGFATFLDSKLPPRDRPLRVSVGHDSRISAAPLMAAVARGLGCAGVEVVTYGLASTPAMFMSTVTEDARLLCPSDGAIMITASHLPFNRNGLKFFTAEGGASKGDITAILNAATRVYPTLHTARSSPTPPASVDFMERYSADLVAAVRKGAAGKGETSPPSFGSSVEAEVAVVGAERPLEGLHIVVDAGNGAGGFFAGRVLEPLGASTEGSQFLDPDGMFPNHIPNPEDKQAMEIVTEAVMRHKADLGIIFDTDVDRAAAVDGSGREINRNRLIALMACLVLEQHPGTTVVTDSVTSDGLTTFIEQKLGGKHRRFKRGYKNVIDEGIRLNTVGEECHLAIETSGHGALKENRWLDDGAYLMVKLLIKLAAAASAGEGRGSAVLTGLIEGLEDAAVEREVRIKINQSHPDLHGGGFREYGERVVAAMEAHVAGESGLTKAPVNFEGIRVSGHGGWFLLRLSLHDPVLALNLEGSSEEAVKELGKAVLGVVADFSALDFQSLESLVKGSA